MTVDNDDPFALDPIERDQYDRPKIHPLKRGKPDLKTTTPYTRVSTFASSLADMGGLLKWSLWHCALGFGRNPDLAAMAGVFGPTVDDMSRHDKQALDRLIETAHDRSGGIAKANHGTAVHAMTEPDRDPFVPERMAADVASYHAALEHYGLKVVATEQFIVNDELQAAGTFDHAYELTKPLDFGDGLILPPGYRPLGDKKTGKLHLDSQSIQLAVYANGALYDGETGERTAIEASKDYGILVHIPKGEGRTDLYLVDLKIGYAAAKLAAQVRKHRTRKDIGRPFTSVDGGPVAPAPAVEEPAPVVEAESAKIARKLQAVPEPPVSAPAEPEPIAAVETPAEPETSAEDPWGDDVPARDIAAECAATEAEIAAKRAGSEEAAAVELLKDKLGAVELTGDPILDAINGATDSDQCAAIWRANRLQWNKDVHTPAVKARLASLGIATKAAA